MGRIHPGNSFNDLNVMIEKPTTGLFGLPKLPAREATTSHNSEDRGGMHLPPQGQFACSPSCISRIAHLVWMTRLANPTQKMNRITTSRGIRLVFRVLLMFPNQRPRKFDPKNELPR